jgi:hypothetical protein
MGIKVDNSRKRQEKGVWTTFSGSQFLVAHSSSLKFQRILTRLQAPHRRKIDKGNLDPAVSRDILCQALSEGLLLDWKNVGDSQGNDIPFSAEVAAQALANNDDLREYLQEFALDLENFRAEETQDEGNS